MAKVPLENVRIASQEIIPSPRELGESYPVSDAVAETVAATRAQVQRILERSDPRLLVVVGPCSIHDEDAALEYARRLRALAGELRDTLLLVMRTYFEKPRTRVGWKGFINDPHLDDSFRLDEGLARARTLLLAIGELGLGVGTEALDPVVPQYLGDLTSWVAIGARTIESQTHREMASGLSAPVGFKNGTDGNVEVAINALEAARHPHSFLGVTRDGRCAVFRTTGNPHGHVILRGGTRPNYDSASVAQCEQALADRGLPENILVDCSHGNSRKRPELQVRVLDDCISQIRDGNRSIIGFMLESHLEPGRQDLPADLSALRHGVSITDACLGWSATAEALRRAHERLVDILPQRAALSAGVAP